MTLDLSANFHSIRSCVPPEVTIVAVSKKQSLEKIEALYRLGHRDFGENYVQELLAKAEALAARGMRDIRWHLIGPLQRNKVKDVLSMITVFHALDSERLAEEFQKRWPSASRDPVAVFVQVNLESEPSKSGVDPSEVRAFCEKVSRLPCFDLRGLMCIPDPRREDLAAPFRHLKELERECRPFTKGDLSMGMSDDWEIALREGSTHLRIGTALFGTRET